MVGRAPALAGGISSVRLALESPVRNAPDDRPHDVEQNQEPEQRAGERAADKEERAEHCAVVRALEQVSPFLSVGVLELSREQLAIEHLEPGAQASDGPWKEQVHVVTASTMPATAAAATTAIAPPSPMPDTPTPSTSSTSSTAAASAFEATTAAPFGVPFGVVPP